MGRRLAVLPRAVMDPAQEIAGVGRVERRLERGQAAERTPGHQVVLDRERGAAQVVAEPVLVGAFGQRRVLQERLQRRDHVLVLGRGQVRCRLIAGGLERIVLRAEEREDHENLLHAKPPPEPVTRPDIP